MKLGVCYYPEHWPEDMWADDAACMRVLGLTTVRIGEFAWSRIEPEPGQYEWAWLDRAVSTLHDAGLEVIMGTPTATPPKWLIDAHPDILPCDEHGQPRNFGSRRHYSFSSKTYRRESARIVEAMASRYGSNPAIVMWQTDNEYGCHDTVVSNDADARAAFRAWLTDKYQDVEALNGAWGTVFWSQEYRSFGEIDPPVATVTEPTPAHVMDWRRFSSDQVASYNAMQIEIIRRHAPGVDVTHNFMGHFTEFDHFPVGEQIDISTWDSYPLGFLEQAWWDGETKLKYMQTGHPDFAGFHHDLYRAMSKGRFGVMEQQPGPVNWARYNPAPRDGMVALWTLEAVAHGAELVSYFRWRQAPFAQEQMHAGLNRPDNVADQASTEAEAALQVLKAIGELPDTAQAQVALVYDYEAHWAYEIQPQGRSFRHDELTFMFYTALRELGLDVDIVSPDQPVDGYKLLVVPSSPMLTEARVERWAASGAHILCGPRTGSKTDDFQIPSNLAPGQLQDLLPIKVHRVESLRPGVVRTDARGAFERWQEHIVAKTSELVALDGIVWSNDRITYVSAWPEAAYLSQIVQDIVNRVGVKVYDLPEGLRVRRRGELIFVFGYGADTGDLSALSLLSGYNQVVLRAQDMPLRFAVYRKN
jgi:beta-galactosidase